MASRLQDTVARNTAFLLVAQVLLKLFGFVTVIVLANQLDVVEFGVYNFVIAFASLFIPLCDVGIDTFLIRELAAHPERHRILAGSAVRVKALAGAITILLILAAYAFYPKADVPAYWILLSACIVVLRTATGTVSAFYRARQMMGPDSRLQVTSKFIEILSIGMALAMRGSVQGLLTVLLVGAVVQMAYAIAVGMRQGFFDRMSWDRGVVSHLLRGGIPFAATGISVMIYFQIDAVMLTYMVGEQETGLYRAATNIMFAISGFSAAVVLSLFPMIAEQFERDRAEATRAVSNAIVYSLALAGPVAVGGSVLAGPMIETLYRSTFAGAGPVFSIIVWWLPISFVTNILGHTLGAIGKQSIVLRVTLLNAAFNLGLNYALIPTMGATGAAISTVATEVLGFFLLRQAVYDTFGPVFDIGRLLRVVGASVPLLALVAIGRSLPFFVTFGLGIIAYGMLAFLFKALTRDEFGFVLSLVRRPHATDPHP